MFSSKTHFFAVVLSSLVATVAGVALSYGGWRRGDARAVLVGTAFTVMASLLLVHGFASPGFIVEMNGVVALTGAAHPPGRRRHPRSLRAAVHAQPSRRGAAALAPGGADGRRRRPRAGGALAAGARPVRAGTGQPARARPARRRARLLRRARPASAAHRAADAATRRSRRLRRARLARRRARPRADADLSRPLLVARPRARGRGRPARRPARGGRSLPFLAVPSARGRPERRRDRLRPRRRSSARRWAASSGCSRRRTSTPKAIRGGSRCWRSRWGRSSGCRLRGCASSPPAGCCTTSASSPSPTRC